VPRGPWWFQEKAAPAGRCDFVTGRAALNLAAATFIGFAGARPYVCHQPRRARGARACSRLQPADTAFLVMYIVATPPSQRSGSIAMGGIHATTRRSVWSRTVI
jgi:hypothetical protein